jgi:hypothetical protein
MIPIAAIIHVLERRVGALSGALPGATAFSPSFMHVSVLLSGSSSRRRVLCYGVIARASALAVAAVFSSTTCICTAFIYYSRIYRSFAPLRNRRSMMLFHITNVRLSGTDAGLIHSRRHQSILPSLRSR